MAWIVKRDLKHGPRYYVFDRVDGRVKQLAKADTYALAKKRKAEIETSRRRGSSEAGVLELFDRWLLDKKVSVEPSTYRVYKRTCQAMLGHFGSVRSLEVSDIRAYRDEVIARASRTTAAKHLAQLRRIYTWGMKQGLCQDNPAMRVEMPVGEHVEQGIIGPGALSALLADADDLSRVIVLTAMLSGLRASEVIALRGKDVSVERRCLTVERKYVAGEFGRPKSRSGNRTVPIPEALAVELKSRALDDDLIFTGIRGGPLNWHNFWQRTLRPLFEAHGLKGYRLHNLRHTYASLLAEAGEDPKRIQQLLGHANISITYDKYVHRTGHAQTPSVISELADLLHKP